MSALSNTFKAVVLLNLAACSSTPGYWDTHSFDGIESTRVMPGEFGATTAHNTAVMTGAAGLTHKFATDVQNTVTFAFGSSALTAQAQQVLQQQASWMSQFPELRFRVYGHTDLVGGSRANQALGLRRAQAVVRYLVAQGISADRVDAVISAGETQPLVATQSPEQRNRRTVTEVLGHRSGRDDDLNGIYGRLIHRAYTSGSAAAKSGGASQ